MKMWMSVEPDESMLPMNYSIITFEDEKTKEEGQKFQDLHFCSRNASELEEYTLLMKAVNLAAEMNLNETEVAIFAYTTDLVDSEKITSVTEKLASNFEGRRKMICFKTKTQDSNQIYGCGENPVFALRGDVIKMYSREMENVKPYMRSIQERRIGWLTGIVRHRANIEGLSLDKDCYNLIQLPFELKAFKDFYEDNYDWGMDRKPPKLMDYDLPDIYREEAQWTIEIEVAPSCDASSYLYLVKSSRTNTDRRNFLRAFQEFDKNSTKIPIDHLPQMRFLIGKGKSSADPSIEASIQEEIENHNDLVLGNFIDEYDNLPQKTMTGYTYFAEYCKKGGHVNFIDDDVLLDVEQLDSYYNLPEASDLTCFGFLGENARPHRWGKYNVTFEQWASGHFFPSFCSGPCAGMTAEVGEKIYQEASTLDAKGFKLEDVLFTVTGVIRTKAGIAEPSLQEDICKHFPQKTKKEMERSMWQHIQYLSFQRNYM
ncbi:Oidioi.mRNA.OKI2018_I69.chr2.g5195.t1.cds [Oikopleura dioica]|uniref:Hexosyltransferase n=1 Tax=Oikopleura dioica TaxID=34765 RepID=A0ABN7SZ76_OIKDI|nr:Oidioi.mRNA.OKI2018_I69.chr2.g5195.t1.cds [Oikopleura dioica]